MKRAIQGQKVIISNVDSKIRVFKYIFHVNDDGLQVVMALVFI